jgi:uncharacterized protein (TIGR02231 family)
MGSSQFGGTNFSITFYTFLTTWFPVSARLIAFNPQPGDMIMRWNILLLVLLSFSAQAESVPAEITEVTLFADRALVTREATLTLPVGVAELELPALPAWVDPSSIRARIEGGEVLDVKSRREFLTRTPVKEVRDAEDAVQEIQDQMSAVQDELKALTQKLDQIMQAKTFATRELPPEISRRDIPVQYFKDMAEFVFQGSLEVNAEQRRLQKRLRELQPELQARSSRLQELRRGNQLEQLLLTVSLTVPQAGEYALVVTYELPGATWETMHDVRIEKDTQVNIVSLAQVRQTSGEDWENVKLFFSTHRPAQTATIPELEALLLGGRTVAQPMAQRSKVSSWASSNDYYLSNAISFNRASKGKQAAAVRWEGNFQAQQQAQLRTSQVFESLEKRGTTALFEAEGRFTIRTDGNPVRIPYASLHGEGQLMVMAAPEISANAARGVELTYANTQPLLPGDAALFVDGAYIGNTRLEFAGPGESFVLFAGSEDRLKISRKLNHEESDLQRGRRENVMKVHYDITVENTGDRDVPLTLADRIPVSDDKDIDVDHIRIEPELEPSEDGLVSWESVIPAHSTRTFVIRYVVEYPADLQLRSARNHMNAPVMQGDFQGESQPAAGAEVQILNLEKMF